MTRVFLDANVYFAGSVSSAGASAWVLEMAKRGKIDVYASKLVLREADRNLRKKAPASALRTFRSFLQKVKIRIVVPSEEAMKDHEGAVEAKDLPVLAAAVAARSDFFLTLDRKHFLSAKIAATLKRPRIMNPGDFLREIY